MLYAAFIGLLLASYVSPLHEIVLDRQKINVLEQDIGEMEQENKVRLRTIEELGTPEGIERAARELYGMVYPDERVYLTPQVAPEERGGGRP